MGIITLIWDYYGATVVLFHIISVVYLWLLHFPRKPIGEQAPADEISPPHLRGRKLPQPWSVR